jgi:hypothetical protein
MCSSCWVSERDLGTLCQHQRVLWPEGIRCPSNFSKSRWWLQPKTKYKRAKLLALRLRSLGPLGWCHRPGGTCPGPRGYSSCSNRRLCWIHVGASCGFRFHVFPVSVQMPLHTCAPRSWKDDRVPRLSGVRRILVQLGVNLSLSLSLSLSVCVCVCVWERERERERQTDRQRDRETETERETERERERTWVMCATGYMRRWVRGQPWASSHLSPCWGHCLSVHKPGYLTLGFLCRYLPPPWRSTRITGARCHAQPYTGSNTWALMLTHFAHWAIAPALHLESCSSSHWYAWKSTAHMTVKAFLEKQTTTKPYMVFLL